MNRIIIATTAKNKRGQRQKNNRGLFGCGFLILIYLKQAIEVTACYKTRPMFCPSGQP